VTANSVKRFPRRIADMAFPNFRGNRRVWTRDRVLAALIQAAAEIQGPLPTSDDIWNRLKKGRYDLPPASRIYEFFHSFPAAWCAVGMPKKQISKRFAKWTEAEDSYLLDFAGQHTLERIARHLGRTYPAVRARLRGYKIQSRHNQGFLSAAELAKEYNCSCHRIRVALKEGKIKGVFDKKRNRWAVDLADLTPEALIILTAPKHTHKNSETDLGNYYQRHGLKRQNINGKVMVIAASTC